MHIGSLVSGHASPVQGEVAQLAATEGLFCFHFEESANQKIYLNNPSPASRELPLHKGAFWGGASRKLLLLGGLFSSDSFYLTKCLQFILSLFLLQLYLQKYGHALQKAV